MYFESCYPIQADLFLNQRYLKEQLPNSIFERKQGHIDYTLIHNENFIDELKNKCKESLIQYQFQIQDNQLEEKVSISPNENKFPNNNFYANYKLNTHFNSEFEKQHFLNTVYQLFGIIVYGEIENHEEYISRDDVCVHLSSILKEDNNIYNITWSEGNPFINHFFMYEENKKALELPHLIAVGGKPIKKTNKANFYFMKALDDWDNSAYINKSHINDFAILTNEEKKMISQFANAVEKNNVNAKFFTPFANISVTKEVERIKRYIQDAMNYHKNESMKYTDKERQEEHYNINMWSLSENVGYMVLSIDYKSLSIKELNAIFEPFNITFEKVKAMIELDMSRQDW